jgi:RNA polymerase sigma-70 factor (ECF subfamily)
MSQATSQPSLDRFRSYLLLVARLHFRPRLAAKLDPSDVVQQTLVQALQGWPAFRGTTDAELAAWLRQILRRNLANVARDFGRDKRDLAREQSLEAAVADSSTRLEAWLDDQQSSPSQRAERNEHLLQLADALATLPDAQQEAVMLHHLHGLLIDEIAERMERTPAAVAGLLKRGLQTLREKLAPGEGQ